MTPLQKILFFVLVLWGLNLAITLLYIYQKTVGLIKWFRLLQKTIFILFFVVIELILPIFWATAMIIPWFYVRLVVSVIIPLEIIKIVDYHWGDWIEWEFGVTKIHQHFLLFIPAFILFAGYVCLTWIEAQLGYDTIFMDCFLLQDDVDTIKHTFYLFPLEDDFYGGMLVRIHAWIAVKVLELLMFFTRFSVFRNIEIELGREFLNKLPERVEYIYSIIKKVIRWLFK